MENTATKSMLTASVNVGKEIVKLAVDGEMPKDSVVARLEHFGQAARELAISQPALSRSISNLEEELGVTLFDRMGRSVYLNSFGRVFLERVEKGLTEIAMGVQEIQHLKNPYTGTVALGFLQTLGTTILPEILPAGRTAELFRNYVMETFA